MNYGSLNSCRLYALKIEVRYRDCLRCSNQYRQIFRKTTGHDRIDCDAFNRCLTISWCDHGDNVMRRTACKREHALNALRSGRHDWKSIAPIVLHDELV